MVSPTYRLGPDLEVEPSRSSVRRAGEEVFLRAKTFHVLLYLLEHQGQLVTKDDLFSAIWPDVIVTDDVIAQSIVSIRKVLGDDARSPRFVRTVARTGYIFIAPVSVVTRPRRIEAADAGAETEVEKAPAAREVHQWLGRKAWWLTAAG